MSPILGANDSVTMLTCLDLLPELEHRLLSSLQLTFSCPPYSVLPHLLILNTINTPRYAAVQEFCIKIFRQASFSSQMTGEARWKLVLPLPFTF